ncbi:MAG: hypothetical protein M3O80_03910 [Chloroflexota bacterium]|nr:hypothetical protein [Chloroflexota bacterium]
MIAGRVRPDISPKTALPPNPGERVAPGAAAAETRDNPIIVDWTAFEVELDPAVTRAALGL